MPDSKEDLRVYCWEGYDSPVILDPFRHRYGIDVQARTLISDVEAAHEIDRQPPSERVDILNINNAWVQRFLHPRGAIRTLQGDPPDTTWKDSSQFADLKHWSRSENGKQKIGICQRFGTFNLVVNTNRISQDLAQDEGFKLAAEPDFFQRYGILLYEDFNIFHICIAADIDPYQPLNSCQETVFETTARDWFCNAALITDNHHSLNKALIDGQIDFYLSGGVYTASPARLEGHTQVRAVTPSQGPINGLGGIVFIEVTCALMRPEPSPWAQLFLDYLVEPDTAIRVAFLDGTCNPVLQMENPKVLSAFSRAQLDAIQWDTLEEDVSRCAHYDIVPDLAKLLVQLRGITTRLSTAKKLRTGK